jgi:carbonic anhydrase/acetyltransferase-like protein (isoleucine patch superfamily)
MGGATVESNCIVAANAVVRQGQRIPEGHMAYGVPADIRPLTDEQLAQIGETHENYLELSAEYRETTAEARADERN